MTLAPSLTQLSQAMDSYSPSPAGSQVQKPKNQDSGTLELIKTN